MAFARYSKLSNNDETNDESSLTTWRSREPYDIQPGRCVIINNMEFESAKSLPQGKRDEQDLNTLFTSLGFDVKIHQNLTAQQMISNIKSYSEMQHKGVFFLIILSHGTLVDNKEAVLSTDDKAVTIHQLETFCASRCPLLGGVPKIFLVYIDAFRDNKDFTPERMATKESDTSLSQFGSASYGTDMWHFAVVSASSFEYVHLTDSEATEATPDTSFAQIIQLEVKARIQGSTIHQMVQFMDLLTRDYFIKNGTPMVRVQEVNKSLSKVIKEWLPARERTIKEIQAIIEKLKCDNFQAEESVNFDMYMAKYLLKYSKIDANCSEANGWTPPHWAAKENRVTCTICTSRQGLNFSYSGSRAHLCKDNLLFGIAYGGKADHYLCAVKVFLPTPLSAVPGGESVPVIRRFQKECKSISSLQHPNNIQYLLGVCQDPNTRLPLMLPYRVQVNICHDVTQALTYLHSNRVIHRDLFVSNVLLMGNTLEAKVCDFGMARLLDLNPSHRQALTMCSGNPAYMPPEALKDNPKYNEKLDYFSFGVLIMQVLTRSFPQPGDRNEPLQDGRCAGTILMRLVPEVERRKNHIRVALGCLKDESFERPSVQQLCESIRPLEETRLYRESETFGNRSYPQLVFQAAMESYKQYLKCEETSAMIAALKEKINEKAFCVRRTALLQTSYPVSPSLDDQVPIHRAVKEGDVRKTVELLDKCTAIDVTLSQQSTYTLFAQACRLALSSPYSSNFLSTPSALNQCPISSSFPSSPSQSSLSQPTKVSGGIPAFPSHSKGQRNKKKSMFGGSSYVYNLAKSAMESFFGSGRPVPVKEGHINKKSAGGLRAEWKKKYLVLSRTELTYYPSLNDYMSMSHGKTLRLQQITVKMPGQHASSVSRTTTTPTNSELTESLTVTSQLSHISDRSNSASPPPPPGLESSLDMSYNSNSGLSSLGANFPPRITHTSPQHPPPQHTAYQDYHSNRQLGHEIRDYRSPASSERDEFGSSDLMEDSSSCTGSTGGQYLYTNGWGHNRNGSVDDSIMLHQLRTGGISYIPAMIEEDRSATMSRIETRKSKKESIHVLPASSEEMLEGAHQEKPAVNWNDIKMECEEILHLVKSHCTLKREAVGESDTNQEKPAINVTGEWSGHGTGCTYKFGKLKKGHIDESDANQENPAGHLIGEKSGHDGGPACDYGKQTKVCMDGSDVDEQKLAKSLTGVISVCYGDPDNNQEKSALKLNEKSVYSYEKVKKVELSARYSLCHYLSSGWHILWIEFFMLCFVLISAANSVSLSNNLNGSTMACPGQQVRFVCLANSPELYWISPEYIGPPSVKIEFSRALDGVGRTILKTGIAAATLLSTNRSTVISSELVITASQDFPTASVTCGGGNDNVTTTFKVSSGPEIPHNVTASILSSSGDDCTILLRWDLPTDMTTHVFVDFANVTLKIPPQVTIAALPVEKCNLNATVGIRAVDICGRPGARAEVLKNVLHNSGNTTTTAASETYNSICLLCDDSAMTWIITFSLVIGLVIVVITTIIAGISINMFTHAQNITGRHTDKLHTLVNYSHHHNFLKCAQDSERLLKKSD